MVTLGLLLSACGTDRVILAQDDPWTVANGGDPVSIDLNPRFQYCAANGLTFDMNQVDSVGMPLQFTLCDGSRSYEGTPVDIVDAALFLTWATPGDVDNIVIGAIWAGKTVLKLILVAGSAAMIGEGLAYVDGVITGNTVVESHSNRDHNPNISGSKARADILAFIAAMSAYLVGNGPDPRNKCGVTSDATGIAIRAAVWVTDAARATGGYLMWFFVNTPGTPLRGPWGGSYDITSQNFDLDRNAQFERDRGWTWTSGVPCDSIPGGVPNFLQAAQP